MKITYKSIIFILSIIFIQFSCQNQEKSKTQNTEKAAVASSGNVNATTSEASPESIESLPYELVCMVNDAYMGRKQFPVPVGDKIYYGCCEMCVDKLKNSDQYRYGVDPLTKEKVDKTEAFIVMKSQETGEVYYFKSKENYLKYKAKG